MTTLTLFLIILGSVCLGAALAYFFGWLWLVWRITKGG